MIPSESRSPRRSDLRLALLAFRQVGGAVGLAVLIAVATADLAVGTSAHPAAGSVIAGLRMSGWVATGLTLFAALLALRLREIRTTPGV